MGLKGYSTPRTPSGRAGLVPPPPWHYAADFLVAMGQVQDFWQEPAFAELMQSMQKRVHDYVVADQGTAQEALDKLIADWTETFESEGKM